VKKNIRSAVVVVTGLTAVIFGLGSSAAAVGGGDASSVSRAGAYTPIGVDHLEWLDDLHPKVDVPNVDTTVRHREIVLPLPS
jgi:hypothetical protein